MRHDLTLTGPEVVLRPLVEDDAAALAAATAASPSPSEDLRWTTSAPPVTPAAAGSLIATVLADPVVLPFAVVGTADDEFRGLTSFYEHAPVVPRVEIGHTQYARRWWGGRTNPAAKLLLLEHAFEVWRCARVALRCDADNLRSAAAIRRLGAMEEGRLRNHRRRYDGTLADTAYFSITVDQWPPVRAGLQARLAREAAGSGG